MLTLPLTSGSQWNHMYRQRAAGLTILLEDGVMATHRHVVLYRPGFPGTSSAEQC